MPGSWQGGKPGLRVGRGVLRRGRKFLGKQEQRGCSASQFCWPRGSSIDDLGEGPDRSIRQTSAQTLALLFAGCMRLAGLSMSGRVCVPISKMGMTPTSLAGRQDRNDFTGCAAHWRLLECWWLCRSNLPVRPGAVLRLRRGPLWHPALCLSHKATRCGWQTSCCPELLPNIPENSFPPAWLCFPPRCPLAGPLTPPAQMPGVRTRACGKGCGVRKSLPRPSPRLSGVTGAVCHLRMSKGDFCVQGLQKASACPPAGWAWLTPAASNISSISNLCDPESSVYL